MVFQLNLLKAAFDHQRRKGFDFPVYWGRTQYSHGLNFPVFQSRSQYGSGFEDVLRGIWTCFRPLSMNGAQTLLKAGSKSINDGATVKQVFSLTLKPTLCAEVNATAEQVANCFTFEKPTAAPPSSPPRNSQTACSLAFNDLKKARASERLLWYITKLKGQWIDIIFSTTATNLLQLIKTHNDWYQHRRLDN